MALAAAGCSVSRVLDMPANPEREVERLEARLLTDPADVEAMRDLGVILLRTNQVPRGYDYLTQAYTRAEADPKTRFFLGIASEMLGRPETSLRLYAAYAETPRRSPYRELLRGRYEWLSYRLAEQEVRNLLEQERMLGGRFDDEGRGQTSSSIVAVFPLSYLGSRSQYAELGRGVAELVSIDLTEVTSLRVVERVRLQVLLDEMELGQTAYVDPSTAPRLGRLLGAGRLIGGTYDVIGSNLQLDAGVVEVEQGETSARRASQSDALRNLFRVQKELVFDLIESMGIELTPQQREQIEFIPTENMQAFLAYSRGLASKDGGDFAGAARMFAEASRLDPSFVEVAEQAQAMQSAAAASGTPEELLVQLIDPASQGDLMNSRQRSLGESIGAYVLPGPDSRRPAQEGLLPLPPPPPPRR
ncbi:MAG: CsgG/HfaB family protein [Rhodothermales bacterium]